MNIAFIGCGVYALGLANIIRSDVNLKMWVHDESLLNLSDKIYLTTDIDEATSGCDAVFILTSSLFFLDVIKNIKGDMPIYIGTKGILDNELYTRYVKRLLNNDRVYFFSGPNLAKDILNSHNMGFTLSMDDDGLFKKIFKGVDTDYAKDYPLEIWAAFKNIVAIASGMIMSFTNSYSTLISFLVKALKEMEVLGDVPILYGTIGDYFMTNTMQESRNYEYGAYLVTDKKKAQVFLDNNTVEGAFILPIFIKYLASNNISLPVVNLINDIIKENKTVNDLLTYIVS